jgi:hypothetical protein
MSQINPVPAASRRSPANSVFDAVLDARADEDTKAEINKIANYLKKQASKLTKAITEDSMPVHAAETIKEQLGKECDYGNECYIADKRDADGPSASSAVNFKLWAQELYTKNYRVKTIKNSDGSSSEALVEVDIKLPHCSK